MARRAHRTSQARELLPRTIAVLGELGPMVIARESASRRFEYFSVPWRPGTVLCASGDGRAMFALRPEGGGGGRARINQQALQALHLHERFTHREANELYNCVVPSLRAPSYRGDVAIIHYFQEKAFEEDADESGEPSEYVHYFEKPGDRPAYVPLYSVGHGQFYIPPGEWVASERGIEYAPAGRRKAGQA